MPDGSQHIGYQEDSGEVHDLTAESAPRGFGADPPIDQSPVFDPDSDSLYWLRATTTNADGGHAYTVYEQEAGSGQANPIGRYETQDYVGGDAATTITVQHGVVVLGDYRISSNGAAAATGLSGKVAVLPVSSDDQVLDESAVGGTDQAPGALLPDYANNGIEVFGWAGDNAVVVNINEYGRGSNLYRMAIRPSIRKTYTSKPAALLPDNSNINQNAVISPDGKSMAFMSVQGSETTLYRGSTSTSTEPKMLGSDSFSGCLLTWQG